MSEKQSTTKGFAILSIAGIINKILSLVYVPLQLKIIGDSCNGLINSGYGIYIMIFAISNAGIPVALSKMVSEENSLGNPKGAQKVFRVSMCMMLIMGISLSLFMFFGSRLIANSLSSIPDEGSLMIMALAPTLLFTAISSSFRGYFQGHSNMIPTSKSQVLEQFLNSVLTIVFISILVVKYPKQISIHAAGSTIGTSAGALGAALFLLYIYFKGSKDRQNRLLSQTYLGKQRSYKEIIQRMMVYVIPALLGMVAANLSTIADPSLFRCSIGLYLHDTKVISAMYSEYSTQFLRILNMPLAIAAALPTALMPILAALVAQKNFEHLSKKIHDSYKAVFIIIIPSVFGLVLLAEPIITLAFPGMVKGGDVMMIGAWMALPMAIIYIQTAVLISAGKTFIAPVNLFFGVAVKIALSFGLMSIPALNIKGAAIGTTLGYTFTCILNQRAIRKHLGIKMNFVKLAKKPLLAALIMGVVTILTYYYTHTFLGLLISNTILLNDICVILAVGLSSVIYLMLLISFKEVSSSDILKLPMGRKINGVLSKLKFLRLE